MKSVAIFVDMKFAHLFALRLVDIHDTPVRTRCQACVRTLFVLPSGPMKERIRFELRLKEQEREALEKLAEKHGVSMSYLVAGWIRRKAKREKVWS